MLTTEAPTRKKAPRKKALRKKVPRAKAPRTKAASTQATSSEAPTGIALWATTERSLRLVRWLLLLCAGVVAVWIGNGSVAAWGVALSPAPGLERSMVEMFGLDFQWAALLASVPALFWASERRIAFGLAIPLGLFAAGHGVMALTFMLVIVGVGMFHELDANEWQAASVTAAGTLLLFAVVNPWAAAIGGGAVLATHFLRREAALRALIVFLPSVIGGVLLLIFVTPVGLKPVDVVAAIGFACLGSPSLALIAGLAAFFTFASGAHPTVVLAGSVGVSVVDVPVELAPEFLAEGLTVQPGARFALVLDVGEDETSVGSTGDWTLIDRADFER